MDSRSLQEGVKKDPRPLAQGKNHGLRRHLKTWRSGSRGRGGYHCCGGPKFPRVLRFLCGFSFHHTVIVRLGYKFVFKGDVSRYKKNGGFHHLSFTHTLTDSIKGTLQRIGRRRSKGKRRQHFECKSNYRHSGIWISNFLHLFSFKFSLVRFNLVIFS